MEILNTRTDTHASLTSFSTVCDVIWFYQNHACRKMQSNRMISIFLGQKRKSDATKYQHFRESTVCLKQVRKSSVRQGRHNDKLKSLKCGRILPPFGWDGPDSLLMMEVRSQHDKTYEIFLSLRRSESFHVWSVVRKVQVCSYDIVIIDHHALYFVKNKI